MQVYSSAFQGQVAGSVQTSQAGGGMNGRSEEGTQGEGPADGFADTLPAAHLLGFLLSPQLTEHESGLGLIECCRCLIECCGR